MIQVYASKPNSKVERADKELKAFKKIEVNTGESVSVDIELPIKELAYYKVSSKQWVVEPGTYQLKLGNSSRNIYDIL